MSELSLRKAAGLVLAEGTMLAALYAIPGSGTISGESPCIVPSADAIHAADNFLHQPEDPMVTRYNLSLSGKGDATKDAINGNQYQAWVVQKAAKLGLTQHTF